MKRLPMRCAAYSPRHAGFRFPIISATPSTASVLRTSNPGLAQQAEAVTVRMAVRCDSPPEGGQAVVDDCTPSLNGRVHNSMNRSVPSPENVVTEVTKALEQIS